MTLGALVSEEVVQEIVPRIVSGSGVRSLVISDGRLRRRYARVGGSFALKVVLVCGEKLVVIVIEVTFQVVRGFFWRNLNSVGNAANDEIGERNYLVARHPPPILQDPRCRGRKKSQPDAQTNTFGCVLPAVFDPP